MPLELKSCIIQFRGTLWLLFCRKCWNSVPKSWNSIIFKFKCKPCADSESFVRGGSNFDNGFFCCCCCFQLMRGGREGGSKYHFKRAAIGPPAKRHWNGISLACRWWPNIQCCLGSFVIFRGSGPLLQRNLYFCYISRGVSGPPVPPLDPRMQSQRIYFHYMSEFMIKDTYVIRAKIIIMSIMVDFL